MADKKNKIERQTLNENSLENISGGVVYRMGDSWVASDHDHRKAWACRIRPDKEYFKVFSTKEEALAYDTKMKKNLKETGNIWGTKMLKR